MFGCNIMVKISTVVTSLFLPSYRAVKFDEGDIKKYAIYGDYPVQTPEQVSQYDLGISRLIRETDLMVPPNR